MKILALDQSSRVTGWAIFDNGALEKYGKFNAYDVGEDMGKRLVYIRSKVVDLIKNNNIEHVYFEEIQLQNTVGNNVVTFKTLAYVQAVIIELLYDLGIPYTIVASSSWKSTLGIKGRARTEQKQNAQKWVINTYQVKPTQDECDAICIGAHSLQKNTASSQGFDWSK